MVLRLLSRPKAGLRRELPRPTPLVHACSVEGGASCFSDRTCRNLDCIRGLSTAVPVSAGVRFGPSRAYRFDGPVATRRRLHTLVFAFECRPSCRARHTLSYARLWHQACGTYSLPARSLRSLAEEGALRLHSGNRPHPTSLGLATSLVEWSFDVVLAVSRRDGASRAPRLSDAVRGRRTHNFRPGYCGPYCAGQALPRPPPVHVWIRLGTASG